VALQAAAVGNIYPAKYQRTVLDKAVDIIADSDTHAGFHSLCRFRKVRSIVAHILNETTEKRSISTIKIYHEARRPYKR
jgi:hypothetical protein